MIKKSYYKDVFKSITHTFSRFISILLIVGLGAGFYAGLNATAPDMRSTVNNYYKENNMMDLRLISTMGFTQSDVENLKQYNDIKGIMATYNSDVICKANDDQRIAKIHSIPKDNDSDNYMSRAILKEGRMPQKAGECVINLANVKEYNLPIGAKLQVEDVSQGGKDYMTTKEFEVVGYIESPLYLTFNLGSTTIGNGKLNNYIYVTEDNFDGEYYTEVILNFKSTSEMKFFSDEYLNRIDEIKNDLERISDKAGVLRKADIVLDNQEKIDDAKQQLEQSKAETEDKLNQAQIKLDDSEKELDNKRNEITQGKEQIKQGEAELKQKETETNAQLKTGQDELNSAKEQLSQKEAELSSANNNFEQAKIEIEKTKQQIIVLREQGLNDMADSIEKVLSEKIKEYNIGKEKYEAGKKEFDNAKQQLEKNQKLLDEKALFAQNELSAAKKQLEEKTKELQQGEALILSANEEINKGKEELAENREKAEKEFTKAQQEIEENEKKLEDIPLPQWYMLDLETNAGYVSLKGDADRIAAIATVFPVIFFLVAALVALTTMTRMVEEERVLIGTYKALGYTKMRIGMKYITYGLISSVLGASVGIIIGQFTLPSIIWNAYRMMYVAPKAIMEINPLYSTIAFVCAVGITIFAIMAACMSSLKENASRLMMPKAPKIGKRILLERIPIIWNRFSFSYKVTFRNLFRYKKRLFMTIIGIAGCTGLLLTGFGVRDSITDIVDVQFKEIYKYDTTIGLKTDDINDDLEALLADKSLIRDYLKVRQKSTDIINSQTDKKINGYTFIAENSDKLNDFINIRERKSKNAINFNADSVVITEKLAKELGVSVGDKVYFNETDEKRVELEITDICENYVYHYLYIGSNHIKQIEDNVNYETIIGTSVNFSPKEITPKTELEKISSAFLVNEDVSGVSFTEDISNVFEDMIKSLNSVVLVLIFCAGMLAFIVLYNLTNININERKREIATIKVLGFYDIEVSSYIYREIIALTLIGMAVGLFIGVFMHSFVIQTAEVDMVMFGRNVAPLSFVWSALITIGFSVIVNLVMHFKLKKVDMVESLKSVE